METRLLPGQRHAVNGGKCVGKYSAFAAVQIDTAAEVAAVETLHQKAAKRFLLEPGHGAGGVGELCLPAFQQSRGQNDEGHTDGGGNRAGEGTHVNDPAFPVHALQGRNGTGGIAEFAVVVILDEVAVGSGIGPMEEAAAPSRRHSDTQGELVGGSHVGQPGFGGFQSLRGHSVFIHRDRNRLPTQTTDGGIGSRVAGIFQSDGSIVVVYYTTMQSITYMLKPEQQMKHSMSRVMNDLK